MFYVNVKRLLPVLLMILFLLGVSGEALANSDQPTRTDCDDSVAACIEQNGDQSKTASTNSEDTTQPLKTKSNPSTVTTTVKVIFALIFVVGLMIVVLKLLHKRTQIIQQGKGIQTLGGAMLGNQRSVQMVKVGERILIVGVGDNVSLIKEIDDQEEMKGLISQYESGSRSIQMNTSLLEWMTSRLKTRSNPRSSFQETLKQRLDEVKKGRSEIYETMKKEQNND